jgi:hypothetical protein
VYLYFTGKSLSVKSGANECLGHFDGTSAFDLEKISLLNDVCHLLLLLLSFVGFFLQIIDLLNDVVEAVPVR